MLAHCNPWQRILRWSHSTYTYSSCVFVIVYVIVYVNDGLVLYGGGPQSQRSILEALNIRSQAIGLSTSLHVSRLTCSWRCTVQRAHQMCLPSMSSPAAQLLLSFCCRLQIQDVVGWMPSVCGYQINSGLAAENYQLTAFINELQTQRWAIHS